MKEELLIGKGILWVLFWVGFMLLYTALDVGVWRKIAPAYAKYLNLFSIILCMGVFLILLTKKNHFKINLFQNISVQGILLAIGCRIQLNILYSNNFTDVQETVAGQHTYQCQVVVKPSREQNYSLLRR